MIGQKNIAPKKGHKKYQPDQNKIAAYNATTNWRVEVGILKKRIKEIPSSHDLPVEFININELLQIEIDIDQEHLMATGKRLLEKFLNSLTPFQLQVFHMHYHDDINHKIIAETLESTHGSVRATYSVVRKRYDTLIQEFITKYL